MEQVDIMVSMIKKDAHKKLPRSATRKTLALRGARTQKKHPAAVNEKGRERGSAMEAR